MASAYFRAPPKRSSISGGTSLISGPAALCCDVNVADADTNTREGAEGGRQSADLSGRVVGDEPQKVREALASSPGIETVVLRNSPGGGAQAGYQVGQILRERDFRMAVSGYRYSSCSRIFLGGSTRYFTDDYVAENNNVGFHGH